MAAAAGQEVVAEVREVWASNLMEELPRILEAWELFPYVALDTEFPGFLHHTPRFASPDDRYRDIKKNVDSMKLIQVGLTFFGGGTSSSSRRPRPRMITWQINLREFDVSSPTDVRWEPSVELLKRSGVDLERTRNEGVDSEALSKLLLGCGWGGGGFRFGWRPNWVTFHGVYDVAYLLKLLTRSSPLPETLTGFIQLAGSTLGSIFDAKHVAKFCGGLCRGGHLGLTQLSEALHIQVAVSNKTAVAHHQAGYDSLLTAGVFETMIERFRLPEKALEGFLWGIEQHRIMPPPPHREEELHKINAAARFRVPTAMMKLPPVVCSAYTRPSFYHHHHHHGVWPARFPVTVLPPRVPPPMLIPPPYRYKAVPAAGAVRIIFYVS